MQFPVYMEPGSQGPGVNVLGRFLVRSGYGRGGIILDGEFTPNGAIEAALRTWQRENGLTPDGGWGPASRQLAAEKQDFDFEDACRTEGGITAFRQPGPDGEIIVWSPDAPAPAATE